MRTEAVMQDLILSFAREDEHVRVVVMNGSRANLNIPPDIFQDFDIVYFVEDIKPFIHDLEIIRYFGETIIYQLPDEMGPGLVEDLDRYAYLMQFADGSRIDLTFRPLEHLRADLKVDSLTRVLLDKDNLCGTLPQPSDESYWPVIPTEKQYRDCCNEFWWLMPYAAKGLWRGELIGPQLFLEIIRGELIKMLNWYFGVKTDFKRAPGKNGRFFPEVLGTDLWEMVEDSYPGHKPKEVWESLFTMGKLFQITAKVVAESSGFVYPEQENIRVSAFLRKVKELPPDTDDFGL